MDTLAPAKITYDRFLFAADGEIRPAAIASRSTRQAP
jgi:hypothetical protein